MSNLTLVGAAGALALAGSAFGQMFTLTGQNRSISGSVSSNVNGVFTQDGPRTVSAPDLAEWTGVLDLAANPMGAHASQRSSCNGAEIRIDELSLTVGGGGDAGSSGSGHLENRVQFSFRVDAAIELSLRGEISTGPECVATFELSGPGFFGRETSQPAGRPLSFGRIGGTLQPGVYTMNLVIVADTSYVGPGGNGTGMGTLGTPFVLTGFPARCTADFNNDGFVDFFDYDDFVACFETGACPPGRSADVTGDFFVDFFDYDVFVSEFESGC